MLGGQRVNRALAQPGAYPNADKRGADFHAAMEACDGLDGVDRRPDQQPGGVQCHVRPGDGHVGGTPLRCPGGADTGDTCLSDVQIAAVQAMNAPAQFAFPLASGEKEYPGYNVWGADLGITSASPVRADVVTFLALGSSAPGDADADHGALHQPAAGPVDQVHRSRAIPTFDSLSLDPENPGPLGAAGSAS